MPKKVLLFYPPNKRSVVIETLCKAVHEADYELMVLTLSERGSFHEVIEEAGMQAFSHTVDRKPSWKFFTNHIRFLVRFCREHKINFVWSHLQEANLIALFAKPFMKAKVIAFRHHAESEFYAEMGAHFNMSRNKNEVRMDKLINRLARKIVIPSSGVWRSMEQYEGCSMKKVKLIPYIYDFSMYKKPDAELVRSIRKQYDCPLLLIMVSRMVPTKQHLPVFETVQKLVAEGLSIKMIVMDEGQLRPSLEEFARQHHMEDHFIFTGFREDFVNYMAASDLLIHPSLTEASNHVVKELGLQEKAVAVCKGVGDFDDYIEEGRNGYFLDPATLHASLENVIRDAYVHPEKLSALGKELKKDVLRYFGDSPQNRKHFLELLQ